MNRKVYRHLGHPAASDTAFAVDSLTGAYSGSTLDPVN
jgi:hypothetical protein